MKKMNIFVVLLVVAMMATLLVGCSKEQVEKEAKVLDPDVEYIAVDKDGELIIRPIRTKDIIVKQVEIIPAEEYEKLDKKDEDAVKQALLNGTFDFGGASVTFLDGRFKGIK